MKCKCCNINPIEKNPLNVCPVCNQLINQSAYNTIEDYKKNGGCFPQPKPVAPPFNFTNAQIIEAVEEYMSKCQPNGWGAEDDAYYEHMGEMEYIIEQAKEGNKNMEEVCADLCFNPATYLKAS